jgi:DNA-binding transcriptional MocR family regulator
MVLQLKRSRLFEQVADILEQRIRDLKLMAGAELPSERQLMAEFGVGLTAWRSTAANSPIKNSSPQRARGHLNGPAIQEGRR